MNTALPNDEPNRSLTYIYIYICKLNVFFDMRETDWIQLFSIWFQPNFSVLGQTPKNFTKIVIVQRSDNHQLHFNVFYSFERLKMQLYNWMNFRLMHYPPIKTKNALNLWFAFFVICCTDELFSALIIRPSLTCQRYPYNHRRN